GTVALFNDEFAETDSYGFNLIGSISGPIIPGAGDQFNITDAALKLGPLQNNGGPTFTHAPLCGSPAIDAGDNTDAPATDQRGFARIFRGVIDIGAGEDSNTAPTVLCPAPVGFDTHASRPVAATVSVQVADADSDELVVLWSMDGATVQTNLVSGTSTPANVSFTASFGVGSHSILLGVTDKYQCEATCSTTVTIVTTNTGPVALNDNYSVNEDATLT